LARCGYRSCQAIVRQAGYQDQIIQRHVALAPMAEGGSPRPVSLEVRNPLTTTAVLSLTHELIGLPGWRVEMPATVTLGPGEAVDVNVRFIPSQAEAALAMDARPGDEGRMEIWTHTADGRIVGGAWLQVWQRMMNVYLPLILMSATTGNALILTTARG